MPQENVRGQEQFIVSQLHEISVVPPSKTCEGGFGP